MASMEGGEKGSTKMNKYSCACSIVASMISIIFGYDTGVMSGAMIFIKEELQIEDTQVEILAGILNICALVGSLFAGRTSDKIGRRYTIVVASIIFMVGSILMGYGPSYAVLLTGRCIAGIGVGFALMIAPVYTSEIAAPTYRGFLSSLPELCISLGILSGYISNYFFGKLSLRLGWRLMLGVAAIPSLGLAIGILQMPESPRWLVLQGRLKDAKEILLKISNSKEEAETRLADIKLAAGIDAACTDDIVKLPKKTHGEGVWKELLLRPSPTVRRILLAGIGIHFFQHAVGIEAVILYGPRIFKKAGVHSKDKLLLATVGVGITKTTFILVSQSLVDKVGRRRLLLISTGGCIVALGALGFALTIAEHSKEIVLWALCLSIVAVYIFMAFFSIGLAPVTWVYSSEIFPLKLRAQGMSLGVAVNRLMNATISMTFIEIYKAITIGGTFFMFSGIAVLAWIFFYIFLPETKGRSLEEIEMLFDPRCKSKNSTESGVNVVLDRR
ncbi:Polyol transporter [Thalictrum thalictroides]|uniref:Polyol transporter n=1 Tax=Thalictrum thalictroides TaxID=46969 RepID=A0A7J6VYZ2_THATH|nr:Polyol transporter [Thalictrum thalictroides]